MHFGIIDASGNAVDPEDYVDPNNPYPKATTNSTGGSSTGGGSTGGGSTGGDSTGGGSTGGGSTGGTSTGGSSTGGTSTGVISQQLLDMLAHYEGGAQYKTVSGDYIIFNNGVDDNLELTCGVAIGTLSGKVTYPSLIPNPKIGGIVSKEVYNQVFQLACQNKINQVNNACTKNNVTLTQNQWDAAFLFTYNMAGNGEAVDDAIKHYKEGGAESYYQCTLDHSLSLQSIRNRRKEEYELFKYGTYIK